VDTGLIIALAIVAAIGAAAWSYYSKKKRREGLAFVARQLGLTYSEDDTRGCGALPFELLHRGDGRGTENVLLGNWQGMDLLEFDYWYYTESTDSEGHRTKSYSHFSCAVAGVQAALSPLTIGRENLLTRLADAVGLDDIEFETQEFNDEFNVKSKDRKFANDFVDQRMMAWLLSAPSDMSFETCARWLLCYSGKRGPTDLIPLLGTLKAFRDQVPRVVYDLYRLDPSPDPFLGSEGGPEIPPPPAGTY
jgi:hypothetical protein